MLEGRAAVILGARGCRVEADGGLVTWYAHFAKFLQLLTKDPHFTLTKCSGNGYTKQQKGGGNLPIKTPVFLFFFFLNIYLFLYFKTTAVSFQMLIYLF